jgi:hypothetical protein
VPLNETTLLLAFWLIVSWRCEVDDFNVSRRGNLLQVHNIHYQLARSATTGDRLSEREESMFSELQALIAVAENRSMERAASSLFVTPSALTRRIQRLETELGLVVLDRHFKPPKLTQAGIEVLEKSRSILASLEGLKASTCGETPVVGPFRLGLSHAVAEPAMSKIITDLELVA